MTVSRKARTLTTAMESVGTMLVKPEGATAKDFAVWFLNFQPSLKKNDTIAAVTAALATKNEELAAKEEKMLRILGNQEREGKCNCSIVAQNYVRGAQKSHHQTT